MHMVRVPVTIHGIIISCPDKTLHGKAELGDRKSVFIKYKGANR